MKDFPTQRFLHVSAGGRHTVLLRSDGHAVACGSNAFGQCRIPEFLDGQFYVQVLAMKGHTVLLRNDGRALAFGSTSAGQCNLPSLTPGTQYISGLRSPKNDLLVQLDFVEDDAVRLRCSNLGGQEMLCSNAHDSEPAWGTHKRIACELNVVLQDLQLLTSNLSGNSKSQASVSHIVIGAEA